MSRSAIKQPNYDDRARSDARYELEFGGLIPYLDRKYSLDKTRRLASELEDRVRRIESDVDDLNEA